MPTTPTRRFLDPSSAPRSWSSILRKGKSNSVKVATTACTITIGAQEIKHAVRYENDPVNPNAIVLIGTAHGVVVSNLNDKAGCTLIPKGAIGKYVGKATATCFRDDGSELGETNKTTPTGLTTEGPETECKVSNL